MERAARAANPPASGLVNLLLGTPPPHRPRCHSLANSDSILIAATVESISAAPPKLSSAERQKVEGDVEKMIVYVQHQLPAWSDKVWNILKKSIGGFLGVAGFLLSLIMVPIYLFFLLKERPRIERRWRDYLPLRPSPLKDEIASALSEINSYVIAYFRGQLLVCLVDGTLIGSALTLLGLELCAADRSAGRHPDHDSVYRHRDLLGSGGGDCGISMGQFLGTHLWVTVIFIVIQNLEGMFYAPRIVGQFGWSASDDRYRLDFRLGLVDWRLVGPDSGRSVDRDDQGVAHPLRLGAANARQGARSGR